MQWIKLFVLCVIAFIPLDLLWLGYVGRGFYTKYVGHYMRTPPDWTAAIIFYFIFLAGLTYFVVKPSLNDPFTTLLFRAAFFGLISYGTYELVNRAVLENWPWPIVVIDILWGIFLCSAVACVSWYFGRS